ncbi:hypothetical protein [Enterobacter cloacae]|uniref:hypothetical protein n=1 Tax=Enterobacter cloacae TaxID=550 RepID=UPI00254EE329|nr:hypothetical protein [Enterobacter cloacae]
MFQRERGRADAAEKRNAELSQKADIYDMLRQDYGLQGSLVDFVDWQAKRIADQSGIIESARTFISEYAGLGDVGAAEFIKIIDRAAGKGEAS